MFTIIKFGWLQIVVLYSAAAMASTSVSVSGTCTRSSSTESPETKPYSTIVFLDSDSQGSFIEMNSVHGEFLIKAYFSTEGKFKNYANLPANDHRQFGISGQLKDKTLVVHYAFSKVWGTPLQPGWPETEGWAGMDCKLTGSFL